MTDEEILRRELKLAYDSLREERPLRIQTAVENEHLRAFAYQLRARVRALENCLASAPDSEWNAFWMAGYDEWLKRSKALLATGGFDEQR